ncbi:hypothetical protein F52700_1980 [Fusarium sp. NRRL 52700]|nr:hypothetical protein F52700_1980 [Fusarium sp. NRRL 52700]
MVSFYQFDIILLGLLLRKSQANLLGDAHLLKRYPQAHELAPAAAHVTTSTLAGNDTGIRTSIYNLLPISTRQLVDGSTLHSLHSRESTGNINHESIDPITSEALSLLTGSIPAPSSAEVTSVTSIGIDWTALLPGTPATGKAFSSTPYPTTGQGPAATKPSAGVTSGADTSFDAGSSRITGPATDTTTQLTSNTLSKTSMVLAETSETSRGGPESTELGFGVETDNPPRETSWFTTFPEETTDTYEPTSTTVQTQDEQGSMNPSSEALTASDENSQTLVSSQLGTESSTTNLPNSPDTAQPSTTTQPTQTVKTSIHEPTTTKKALPISRLPTTTDIVPSPTVVSKNSIVTGTDGTIATYVPEQNKDYISSTGTTTTTDDDGAAIVIFPFGWFWKVDGVRGGGGVAKPPAPTANPVLEKEPGNKNEDDNDQDDDNASTTED